MKHLLKSVSLLAMLFFVVVAVGQNREGFTANNNFMNIHMLTKHLDLTAEQVEAIKELMDTQKEEIIALRSSGNIADNREAYMEAVREIKAGTEANVLKLLTPEQLTKYNEILEKQKIKTKGHNNGLQGNQGISQYSGQIGMLDRHLDLTEEQVSSIKEILNEQRAQMMDIRKNVGDNPDREAIKERVESIRTATENAIKALLNAEQLVKYNELLAKRKNKGGKTINPVDIDGKNKGGKMMPPKNGAEKSKSY